MTAPPMTRQEALADLPIIPRAHPEYGAFGCGLCEWQRDYWKPLDGPLSDLRQVRQCPNCRAAALREHHEEAK